MKAAVVRSFDRPLEIEELPIPEPGAEQVLVRIEACGLCHTDIHAARGEWPVKPTPPFIPGHEGVGIVEQLGPGNTHGVPSAIASPCRGSATPAATAATATPAARRCARTSSTPATRINGGFAEYAVGYARHVVRVPAGIDPLDAAPLTCAGVTTYKAVKVSGATSADLVAVFGAGGLGHLAIQYARITGAAVVAVDTNAARLESARELGAEHLVHVGEEDPGRRHPAPRRRRRGHRHRGQPERLRAGHRLARPGRHARLRRPAGREPDAASRSSRPCSAASTSAARSSARTTTSRRCSSCTAAA